VSPGPPETNKVELAIEVELLQRTGSQLTVLSTKSLKKRGLLTSEKPITDFGQLLPSPYRYPVYNVDSIYQELIKEASNIHLQANQASWLRTYADSIKSRGNNEASFFPHCDFDEVHIFRVNEGYFRGESDDLTSNRLSKDSFQLSSEQITSLLLFINNPLNFAWGECGTAIPQYQVQFYLKGKLVNRFRVACEYGQLSMWQTKGDINYLRSRYGGVDYRKRQPLIDIVKECGAYFEKFY